MDFLGFLEEKMIFLEFLVKRKLSPPTGRTGSPDPSCGRGPPWPAVGLGSSLASRSRSGGCRCGWPWCGPLRGPRPVWRAAPDPGDPSAATRTCGRACARS
jgi:hypothetical protein